MYIAYTPCNHNISSNADFLLKTIFTIFTLSIIFINEILNFYFISITAYWLSIMRLLREFHCIEYDIARNTMNASNVTI